MSDERTRELLGEIATGSRASVAVIYAGALHDGNVDFPLVNAAIMARWSKTALLEIKRLAWNIDALLPEASDA